MIKPVAFDSMQYVDWSWPKMDEIDENTHQDAVQKKLSNLTGSYREELGADWKEKLEVIKNEMQWCKENGLPHPAMQMISGGMREEYFTDSPDTT